jgi:hypothetical protein
VACRRICRCHLIFGSRRAYAGRKLRPGLLPDEVDAPLKRMLGAGSAGGRDDPRRGLDDRRQPPAIRLRVCDSRRVCRSWVCGSCCRIGLGAC